MKENTEKIRERVLSLIDSEFESDAAFEREMNLAEKINLYKVSAEGKDAVLTLRLPAGGEDNVNPKILVDKFLEDLDKNDAIYSVCRKMLLLADGTKFE